MSIYYPLTQATWICIFTHVVLLSLALGYTTIKYLVKFEYFACFHFKIILISSFILLIISRVSVTRFANRCHLKKS